jgi:hypothetical protein
MFIILNMRRPPPLGEVTPNEQHREHQGTDVEDDRVVERHARLDHLRLTLARDQIQPVEDELADRS